MSLPFESAFLPLINEANRENGKEADHGKEPEQADMAKTDGPWKQERDLEVEDDEQDGDQVVAHVESPARIVERLDAATSDPATIAPEITQATTMKTRTGK